jgi:hypothetical protein
MVGSKFDERMQGKENKNNNPCLNPKPTTWANKRGKKLV